MPGDLEDVERQLLEEIRGLKRTVRTLSIVFGGILLAVVVLGVVVTILGTVTGSDGGGPGAAADVHAALTPGATAETVTEADRKVRATITGFTWRQGPVFVARIKGGEPESLEADAWTFVLQDGTVLALSREEVGEQTYRFWLEGSLPATGKVRFIHFDPDDSHGDIYFDVDHR